MSDYKDYMLKLGQADLRNYLGQDIVELLVEWLPSGDTLLTKNRMISMIQSIYGTAIFKNKNFRKDLLLTMDKKELFEIRDKCFVGSDKKIDDLYAIVEVASNKPWNKNSLSKYLSKIWGLPEAIFDKEKDDSIVNNCIESPNERFFELLDYQYYIKQRALNVLNSGNLLERMLIHMPTGTGKTKTSMHIITNYLEFSLNKKGLIIWIAHTTELLQQAYDTFTNVWGHLGDGEVYAYKLWGNRNIEDFSSLNGIVFCGLSKLMSIADTNTELFDKLKKECRLIVFDEAHKAAATQTRKVIESLMRKPSGFENRALIGLTATPGRTTEDSYDNELLTNMFGGKLIHIDSNILNQINYGSLKARNLIAENNIIKYFQDRRVLAKMKPERLQYKQQFTDHELKLLSSSLTDLGYDEKEYTTEQLMILAKNKERNITIINKLRELSVNNIPTIVFACSVEHAKMISAMLTLDGISNSLVLGNMNEIDRKKAIEQFKDRSSGVDIIINYEVLTTGFDSKNIKCVFITRPTKSIVLYSQMLGRGLRGPLMGGNEEYLLIDVDDNLNAFDNETAFNHFNDYWRI